MADEQAGRRSSRRTLAPPRRGRGAWPRSGISPARRGSPDAADMKKAGEAKRLTLLAAMVQTLRISARDEVTDMFCKRMAIIHRKGRARLEELREGHRTESERLLEVFGDVLAAVREATAAEEDGDAGGKPEDSVTPG